MPQSSTTSLFRHGMGVRCALGITPWPARGGCHERSPERSTTVLLLDRVGYRRCHRGRDTAHLSRSASRGLRSLMLSGPFKPTIWSRAAVTTLPNADPLLVAGRFLSAPKRPGFALGHRRLQQHAGHIHAAGAFVGYQSRFAQSWLDAHHIVHGGSTPRA